MKLKMYANYDINGLKYPVYGTTPAEINDTITVTVPDEWETYQNDCGENIFVLPDGTKVRDLEINSLPDGRAFYYGVFGKRFYVEVEKDA